VDTGAIAGAWRLTHVLGQEPNSMSNSMSDDYFSFMSSKWEDKRAKQTAPAKAPTTSVLPSDVIDFVEEPQIEVTESFVSDTMIQRIFKRFAA
jgi:hypothetical protein